MTAFAVTPRDVYRAQQTLAGRVQRTPLVPAFGLARELGADIALKLENFQDTMAFKQRGATNAIAALSAAKRERGVVAVSTGNHGRGVAFAARRLGIRAVVVMSRLVPANKVQAIRDLGAEVEIYGESQDEAFTRQAELEAEQGLTPVLPFDHPDVIAGQGTIALEMLADRPDLDTLLVPLSGGGLIAGMAIAAKAIAPDIRIVGISMDHGAAMAESLRAGKPVAVTEGPSLADSLGGGIGLDNAHTFAVTRELVDDVVLVSEAEIADAMRLLYREERVVAEGACCVGIAALMTGRVRAEGAIGVPITGRNIDPELFRRVLAEEPVETLLGAR